MPRPRGADFPPTPADPTGGGLARPILIYMAGLRLDAVVLLGDEAELIRLTGALRPRW
jgi:hypothetical protein